MKEKKDMKKLAFVLALVMCIGLLAAPAAAVSSKGSYGKVPLYKGAITIDGKIDDIYKKGLLIDLAGKFPGNYGGDTTGKAYVLHDGANIYLAIEVDNKYPLGEYTDALANFGTGYKETAAELYFDWKDDGASSMKWIAWADAKSQIFEKDDNAEKGLVKEYKATSDAAKKTYVMEYKIQLPVLRPAPMSAGASCSTPTPILRIRSRKRSPSPPSSTTSMLRTSPLNG